MNKKHNTLRQIEVDGQMIIPYSWWVHTRVFWCFVLIGAVSIPFTERSYRKWRRNEEQTVAMEEQQESLRYEKIRQRTGNVLAQYGMTVKSCLIFNLPYPEKYDYYMVEDNPLSKGKLCVRVSRSERDVIELICYTAHPRKIGGTSGNTVRRYIYTIDKDSIPLEDFSRSVTDFQTDSPALKRELKGYYRYFMEPC